MYALHNQVPRLTRRDPFHLLRLRTLTFAADWEPTKEEWLLSL